MQDITTGGFRAGLLQGNAMAIQDRMCRNHKEGGAKNRGGPSHGLDYYDK